MKLSTTTPVKTQPNIQEKLDWLRLYRTPNVGPITFYQLIEYYGSAGKALDALPELAKKGGRKKPLRAPDIHHIQKEYEKLTKLGGDIVCANDKDYPLALSALDDAPPVLSYIGNIRLTNQSCIGIVGARNASLNGRKFAQKLAHNLGQQDQIIVSGLARGIDSAAHEGGLNSGTIAVVAGGLDVIYPPENKNLYDQIKQTGLIIAESPLSMEPLARHFPKRNRIVSGISTAIIVIEATIKSGSLITARLAGEQGRDVMAVPGHPGDPRAQGPNKLIRDGATLIQNADDVMESINSFATGFQLHDFQTQERLTTPMADPSNRQDIHTLVLQNLSPMPVNVDELAQACHISIPELQMPLLELELAGRLQRLPGNRVVLLDE